MEMESFNNGGSRELNETLQAIANNAQQLFSADLCVIVAINPITRWLLEPPIAVGEADQNLKDKTFLRLDRIVEKALKGGDFFADHSSQQQTDDLDFSERIASLATVTLHTKHRKRPLAVLCLGFFKPRSFSPEDKKQLDSFAEHYSSDLQNTWLLLRYKEIARIGQEINHELQSPDILFQKLQKKVADILDTSYFFMLAIYQPQTNTLDMYMRDRGEYKFEKDSAYEGACAYVMNEKQSRVFAHYSKDPDRTSISLAQITGTEEKQPESLIFVPLLFHDLALGVLTVQHLHTNVYGSEDLQILELLGNQVALALSTLRLIKYLEGLNETAQQLTQQLNSEQLLQDVVDRIRETTKSDVVVLYPYLQSDKHFEAGSRVSGELRNSSAERPANVRPDDIAWLTLHKGEAVFARNSANIYQKVGGDISRRKGDFEVREKIRSTAAVPLRVGTEYVGVLFVNYRQPQQFDESEKNVIRSLANFAAIAIRNSREFVALTRRRVEELEALRKIDLEISKTLKLEQVMQTILEKATSRIPATDAAILLYNPRTGELEAKAAIGDNAERRLSYRISVAGRTGLSVWVYRNREPVRVDNVRTDPKWQDAFYPVSNDASIVSEMDVPLLDGDNVVGVINFESTTEGAFTQADEDFVVTLAGQAVLAVKNAQIYERAQQTADVLSAIQDVEGEIIGRLKLKEVLDKILEKALQLTGSTSGQVMLYDAQRSELNSEVQRGISPERFKERISIKGGIIGWVVKNKKLLNANVCEPQWNEFPEQSETGVRWQLAVPIIDGTEVRGVIHIESPDDNQFTKSHEYLLSRLTELATIALQNAEQYEKAEAGKRKLEALHAVDEKIISQQDTPEQAILVIQESAMELTGAEISSLHLYEYGQPLITYWNKDNAVAEQHHTNNIDSTNASSNIERSIVAEVASTRRPYLTNGDAQDDPNYKGGEEIHSEVAVPLLSGNEDLIGVLNLESPRDFAFDEDDVEVLELFARQAVIAIQNARTYSQARDESERFRLLWEVGRKLAEITDQSQLDQSYDIVVSKIAEKYDGEFIIRRYDESKQGLVILKVGKEREEPPLPFIKLGEGVNGQVARERRTIELPDVDHPPPGVAKPLRSGPRIRTLVVAPIQFKHRYYGNLALSDEKVNVFKEGDVKLIEGLAQQMALTMHRLETVQAQNEAEQQARNLEVFTELGQSAFELTHRLGNDLGLVQSYINNIHEELTGEGIKNIAIDEELAKLLKDVSNVLNMSKALKQKVAGLAEEGKPTQNSSVTPAKVLLEDAKLALPASAENISITWKIDADLANVSVVPGQIIDILFNLIANAIEAMPDGGAISLRAYNQSPFVQIEVADTGPGINMNKQDNVFSLYYSTKRSSGFGLWSARRYARANGGDLILESEPGQGATFILRLPMADKQG